jgi:hypothetical protein
MFECTHVCTPIHFLAFMKASMNECMYVCMYSHKHEIRKLSRMRANTTRWCVSCMCMHTCMSACLYASTYQCQNMRMHAPPSARTRMRTYTLTPHRVSPACVHVNMLHINRQIRSVSHLRPKGDRTAAIAPPERRRQTRRRKGLGRHSQSHQDHNTHFRKIGGRGVARRKLKKSLRNSKIKVIFLRCDPAITDS